MNGGGRFGVGFLIGAVLVGGLMAATRDETSAVTATTGSAAVVTTTAAPAATPWFEQGEAMIGSTAILPRGLNVEDGIAYFDYDLAGIGPSLGVDQPLDLAAPQGDHLTAPEHWLLTTTSGQTIQAEIGPLDSSVRFVLPEPDAQVASIAVVGWRVAVPFGEQVELPIEEGATAEIRRGTVTIETVLEQSISTIVQVDFEHVGDPWQAGFGLRPVDTRWRVSGRQFGGLQLIWEGTDAPETVVLEDAGFEMRAVTGEWVVFTEVSAP